MPSVAALTNIRAQASYLGEGVGAVLNAVLDALPDHIKASDSLTLYAADAVHTIVSIDGDSGSYPLALIAKSNGTACVVHLYADEAATVGTTDSLIAVKVSGTSGEISSAVLLGAGPFRLGFTDGVGLGIAAPATTVGTGAVANDPTVWVLYHAA
jgi:hypothetical protein